MLRHKFSIGRDAPHSIDAVIEIPKTDAMSVKTEVDFATGEVLNAGTVDPPITIYWHYGAAPETLGDEGEPLDIIIVGDNKQRKPGEQLKVRPIGVYRVVDGWYTNDDKIISVVDTEEFAHVKAVSDLPEIETKEGKRSFIDLLENFLSKYRRDDEIIHFGWGASHEAHSILKYSIRKYQSVSVAQQPEDQNVFLLDSHIFIPPPSQKTTRNILIHEALEATGALKYAVYDENFGYLVYRHQVKRALSTLGMPGKSSASLHQIDHEKLTEEKLKTARTLRGYGVTVFTASNDENWLDRAEKAGVIVNRVSDEEYHIENIPGLSARYTYTVNFQRADGTYVALGRDDPNETIKQSLIQADVLEEKDKCIELYIPPGLIPYAVPVSEGSEKITLLTDWTDSAYNIWADKDNRPHLVISEDVRKIAEITGQAEALDGFLETCTPHFEGIHFLKRAKENIYGSPTNSIDVGMAIIASAALAEESKIYIEKVLRREVDNSLDLSEHAKRAEMGLRCSVLPLDYALHSILLQGDPFKVLAVDRPAHGTLDDFHDLFGSLHLKFKAAVNITRTLRSWPRFADSVTQKRGALTKAAAPERTFE